MVQSSPTDSRSCDFCQVPSALTNICIIACNLDIQPVIIESNLQHRQQNRRLSNPLSFECSQSDLCFQLEVGPGPDRDLQERKLCNLTRGSQKQRIVKKACSCTHLSPPARARGFCKTQNPQILESFVLPTINDRCVNLTLLVLNKSHTTLAGQGRGYSDIRTL